MEDQPTYQIRRLITAREFRSQQKQQKVIGKEESEQMAYKLFPYFMDGINEALIAQSGCGVALRLSTLFSQLKPENLISRGAIYDETAFENEMIRLLEQEFEQVTDFTLSQSGRMIVIQVVEDNSYKNDTMNPMKCTCENVDNHERDFDCPMHGR
jgi:hypothetical protein